MCSCLIVGKSKNYSRVKASSWAQLKRRGRERKNMETYRHRDEGEDKEGEGEERALGGWTERKESWLHTRIPKCSGLGTIEWKQLIPMNHCQGDKIPFQILSDITLVWIIELGSPDVCFYWGSSDIQGREVLQYVFQKKRPSEPLCRVDAFEFWHGESVLSMPLLS